MTMYPTYVTDEERAILVQFSFVPLVVASRLSTPLHPRGFTAQAMRDLLVNKENERGFADGFQLPPRR